MAPLQAVRVSPSSGERTASGPHPRGAWSTRCRSCGQNSGKSRWADRWSSPLASAAWVTCNAWRRRSWSMCRGSRFQVIQPGLLASATPRRRRLSSRVDPQDLRRGSVGVEGPGGHRDDEGASGDLTMAPGDRRTGLCHSPRLATISASSHDGRVGRRFRVRTRDRVSPCALWHDLEIEKLPVPRRAQRPAHLVASRWRDEPPAARRPRRPLVTVSTAAASATAAT